MGALHVGRAVRRRGRRGGGDAGRQPQLYANEVNGGRYWDYVAEELPEIVGNFFRISQDPSKTYVAGLSMGGYGAMKLALTHPDRFAAAATLSGALDLDELSSRAERVELFERIFGEKVPDDADVFKLIEAADVDALPRIHVSTGTGCRG